MHSRPTVYLCIYVCVYVYVCVVVVSTFVRENSSLIRRICFNDVNSSAFRWIVANEAKSFRTDEIKAILVVGA